MLMLVWLLISITAVGDEACMSKERILSNEASAIHFVPLCSSSIAYPAQRVIFSYFSAWHTAQEGQKKFLELYLTSVVQTSYPWGEVDARQNPLALA